MKRKYRYRPNRRGVLILAVLSLLMLFTLITITYVAVSKQAMSSSQTANRFEQVRPDPEAYLNGALLQLIRGTNNRNSAALGVSLIADMYGNWLIGEVGNLERNVATDTGQQFLGFSFTIQENLFNEPLPQGVEDYYRGRVLTMIDGPAAGISTRIVFSSSDGTDLHIMAFSKADPGGTNAVVPRSGNRFIINGRAFTGMIAGQDVTSPLARDSRYLFTPNLSSETFGQNANTVLQSLKGLNETYDAVDFNNPLLGWFPAPGSVPQPGGSQSNIIPSLHPIALMASKGVSPSTMFRPSDKFHYMVKGQLDFTGKKFDPLTGPWDVDTDGDGILDAVWVDLGYPVLTTADGRSYKPMFAIRCEGLGGRPNANTGSSMAHTDLYYDNPNTMDKFAVSGSSSGNTQSVTGLQRGQGVGPAEINLAYIFRNGHEDLEVLLQGGPSSSTGQRLPGRYGNAAEARPGTPDDLRSRITTFGLPQPRYIPSGGAINRAYGTPSDRLGRWYVGLDHNGQPRYFDDPPGTLGTNFFDLRDDPYRMPLTRFSPTGMLPSGVNPEIDQPFSVHELERLLRRYDRDAPLLPSRLWELTRDTNLNQSKLKQGQKITVASFSQPRPPRYIVDVVRSHPRASGSAAKFIRECLDPDLLAGLPMDLNTPFGDGFDNDGDREIDEWDEDQVHPSAWGEVFPSVNRFDLNNDGEIDITNPADQRWANDIFAKQILARQLFARRLYSLAMLLIEPSEAQRIGWPVIARQMAQWAVNVVDFRDRDSIMTQFVYDENPFDGWDPETPRGLAHEHENVVYGYEKPLLLMTETIAWHDQRTQYVNTQDGNAYDENGTPYKNGDENVELRQMGRPRGNLLIELFHPHSRQHSTPGWLYEGGGLKLNQTDHKTGRSGVWRLAFSTTSQTGRIGTSLILAPTDITSVAYFTRAPTTLELQPEDDLGDQSAAGKRFFVRGIANQRMTVLGNNYVVIGSSEMLKLGEREPVNGETENTASEQDKRDSKYPVEIDLTGGKVVVEGTRPPTGSAQYQRPTTLGVAMAPMYFDSARNAAAAESPGGYKRRFSISEPLRGYKLDDTLLGDKNDTKYYKKDDAKSKTPDDAAGSAGAGPYESQYYNVYLQRLADPTRPWHAQTNPYLVVDVMTTSTTDRALDLIPYSGDDPNSAAVSPFATRQRGSRTDNLWHASSASPVGGSLKSPLSNSTIGYLNSDFGKPLTAGSEYEGAPDLSRPTDKPFPWLTFNNRPFVSQMELLLVPRVNARDMPSTHNVLNSSVNPYASLPAQFPHLLNFFDEKFGLYRLLEFTYVPSPFVGTQHWLDPTNFIGDRHGTQKYHPPFNRVPAYREPGRMNLNLLDGLSSFQALMNNPDTIQTNSKWTQFQAARRGTDGSNFPAALTNPFRSSYESGSPISATLLRKRTENAAEKRPLFARTATSDLKDVNDPNRNPYFRYQHLMRLGNLTTTRTNVYAIWITLGFFEVTNVDDSGENPLPVDVNYKDGYRLVQELGIDTGDVRRHRAFYIVDRSIPFGFQRGQNHNVHDTILLSRQIE
ncbi:MAG: hypothetical protein IID44_05830 [Planctomycetes bacterium]|nr:hypothetical protein [Planctomycetota bacterium]